MTGIKDSVMLGIRLLSYSLNKRGNNIMLVLFELVGIIWDILNRGEGWIGLWFMLLMPITISQQLNSVAISNLVQSSGKKRDILIKIPTIMMGLCSISLYLVLFVIRLIFSQTSIGTSRLSLYTLVLYGLLAIAFVLYDTVIFRKPAIGYLILIVTVIVIVMTNPSNSFSAEVYISDTLEKVLALPIFDSLYTAFAAGLVLTVISIVLFYALSLALYRFPLSERVYRTALNRAKR